MRYEEEVYNAFDGLKEPLRSEVLEVLKELFEKGELDIESLPAGHPKVFLKYDVGLSGKVTIEDVYRAVLKWKEKRAKMGKSAQKGMFPVHPLQPGEGDPKTKNDQSEKKAGEVSNSQSKSIGQSNRALDGIGRSDFKPSPASPVQSKDENNEKDMTTVQSSIGRDWTNWTAFGRDWTEIDFDVMLDAVRKILVEKLSGKVSEKSLSIETTRRPLRMAIIYLLGKDEVTQEELVKAIVELSEHLTERYGINMRVKGLDKQSLALMEKLKGDGINIEVEHGIVYFSLSNTFKRQLWTKYAGMVGIQKEEEGLKTAEGFDREDMIERFVRFFKEYIDDKESKEPKYIYIEQLTDYLVVKSTKSFEVDWKHLNSFDPELAHYLIEGDWPEVVIEAAEDALMIIQQEPPFLRSRDKGKPPKHFHVRFYNLPRTLIPRTAIEPEYINRLIQVRGIVSRAVETKPFVKKAIFVCKDCGNEMVRLQRPHEDLVKPPRCDACGSRNIELDERKSVFTKFQVIRIQDEPEVMSGYDYQPRHLDVILLDDLPETVIPGDRVMITGILELIPEKNGKKPTFKRVLIANHVLKLNKKPDEEELTESDEAEIRALAEDENLKEKIINSIAPSVRGMELAKEFIALALFGGVSKILPDGTRVRGESHILLVGDPGMAKTHLLRFVAGFMPRSIFTDGAGGTSGVGLTAAAKKDELTGDWVLEAGVLPLADGGYALIDEFEKMKEEDRKHIHVAMSQGQISIAKAGINATLNARTTVIAAANPKYGTWNPHLAPADQIDLPPTIFDRFDVILVIMDVPEPHRDIEDARFILRRKHMEASELMKNTIPLDLLRKYILYARKNIEPKLSKEAEDILVEHYVRLRQAVKDIEEKRRVPISKRQLEALLRLAEAHARMHLRDVITKEDAERAIWLHRKAMELLIPALGDGEEMLVGGRPLGEYVAMQVIKSVIKDLSGDEGAPENEVIRDVKARLKENGYNMDDEKIRSLLNVLLDKGEIYQPRTGYYKVYE